MSEIKRIYSQSLPAMKFVGRHYGEDEKQNGTFSHKWGEWLVKSSSYPIICEYAQKANKLFV